MRFYTVPNAKEARKSVLYATGFIGYFYILTFTIGYGAAALVAKEYLAPIKEGTVGKTSNMAAPLLAEMLVAHRCWLSRCRGIRYHLGCCGGSNLGRCLGTIARPVCRRGAAR
jgi:hypothetical protein